MNAPKLTPPSPLPSPRPRWYARPSTAAIVAACSFGAAIILVRVSVAIIGATTGQEYMERTTPEFRLAAKLALIGLLTLGTLTAVAAPCLAINQRRSRLLKRQN